MRIIGGILRLYLNILACSVACHWLVVVPLDCFYLQLNLQDLGFLFYSALTLLVDGPLPLLPWVKQDGSVHNR